MKKIILRVLVSTLIFSMIAMFTTVGCKKEVAEETTAAAETTAAETTAAETTAAETTAAEIPNLQGKKILHCMPKTGANWLIAYIDRLEELHKPTGVEYVHLDSAFDVERGVAQLEEAITMKPDVIILLPLDIVAFNSAIKKAYDAGIKILTFTQDPSEDAQDFVTVLFRYDNRLNAKISAQMMIEGMKKKFGEDLTGKKVVNQRGPVGQESEDNREKGFDDAIAEFAPGVEILEHMVISTWQKDEAIEKMEIALAKYSQIDGGSASDTMAVGMIQAAEDAGRLDKMVFTGIGGEEGAIKAIREGKMYATVMQDAPGAADSVFALVVDMLEGKEVPHIVVKECPVVNAENIDQYFPE